MLHCSAKVSDIVDPFYSAKPAKLYSVTGAIGQPSPLSSDWAIDRACEPGDKYSLPTNLRQHLIIYKFIARVNGAMSDHDGRPAAQPTENERSVVMAMLEQDLADLERKLGPRLSGMAVLSCPLHKFLHYSSEPRNSSHNGFFATSNLLLLYDLKLRHPQTRTSSRIHHSIKLDL